MINLNWYFIGKRSGLARKSIGYFTIIKINLKSYLMILKKTSKDLP